MLIQDYDITDIYIQHYCSRTSATLMSSDHEIKFRKRMKVLAIWNLCHVEDQKRLWCLFKLLNVISICEIYIYHQNMAISTRKGQIFYSFIISFLLLVFNFLQSFLNAAIAFLHILLLTIGAFHVHSKYMPYCINVDGQ